MAGLTSMWGPPLMMFLFRLRLDKDTWVRSVSGLYLLGSVPLVVFYFANGVLAGNRVTISLLACAPAMAGILLGERVRRLVDEEFFRRMLLIVLLIAGFNMIRRALL